MPLTDTKSSKNVWILVSTVLLFFTGFSTKQWLAGQRACELTAADNVKTHALLDQVLVDWRKDNVRAQDQLAEQRNMYFRMFDSLLSNQYANKQAIEYVKKKTDALYQRQSTIIKSVK